MHNMQVNMYQGGGRPAAASYKSYMTSDAAAGRADGYGLREWRHDPSGALWSVSLVLLHFSKTFVCMSECPALIGIHLQR
jgi:hypothetical protein